MDTPGDRAAAPAVHVIGFDHLVLRTVDVERALRFYTSELGLAGERVEQWRAGAVPFPSVRIDATTVLDLLAGDRSGTNVDHLCVVIEPTDLAALAASGRFEVVDGPGVRWGAQGNATSLYVRDPDGNVVELRAYDRPA
jgi:catechol 2,3-dioxygenase-like lactoylglutathione lyase family enzyme